MPVKKLFDAVIFGLGARAGARAFEEIEAALEKPVETPAKQEKREKRERAEREKAAKDAKKARARAEREVEKELAALKKRLKK
jgi:flagellar motility protein MotE (MotC chaperone)